MEQIQNAINQANKLGLFFKTAFEVEFYLKGKKKHHSEELAKILLFAKQNDIKITKLEEEEGKLLNSNINLQQYEIATEEVANPLKMAEDFLQTKSHLENMEQNIEAIFNEDIIFENDLPPCGLHIHISLHNEAGKNLYQKQEALNQYGDKSESDILLFSIAGLLAESEANFAHFIENDASKKRLSTSFTKGQCITHPTNFSWGANNRTTMLRIPSSTLYPSKRHIEHRLPSPECDIYTMINVILNGVLKGVQEKKKPSLTKIYGNAFDEQYKSKDYTRDFIF